jgi:hypothetical protein
MELPCATVSAPSPNFANDVGSRATHDDAPAYHPHHDQRELESHHAVEFQGNTCARSRFQRGQNHGCGDLVASFYFSPTLTVEQIRGAVKEPGDLRGKKVTTITNSRC